MLKEVYVYLGTTQNFLNKLKPTLFTTESTAFIDNC
jgi:hypothetical protein